MSRLLLDLCLLLLRVTLGMYFVIAGWGKVEQELEEGLGTFYRGAFSAMQPEWLPEYLAAPYGYALPWLEVAFGAMLALGLLGRVAALAIALMLVSFTTVLIIQYGWTGLKEGSAQPFNPNTVMAAGALVLVAAGPGWLSLDGMAKRLFRRKKS